MVGEEMYCLCSAPGLQLIPWGWGWKSLESTVLFFLSLAERKWPRGELVVWLCQVSFDYYPDGNLQVQPFSLFVPLTLGGGRRDGGHL